MIIRWYICKNPNAPKNEFALNVKCVDGEEGLEQKEIFTVPEGKKINVSFSADDVLVNGKEPVFASITFYGKEKVIFSVYCITKPGFGTGDFWVNFWHGSQYLGGVNILKKTVSNK
jgi:hypothetical protein